MRKQFIHVAAAIVFAAGSTQTFAAGFRLPDQDAAATAMAGAFVAQADNPSAVWYNPAAMTQLEGAQMGVGFLGIFPIMKHENSATTEVTERKLHIPAELFGTRKINNSFWWGIAVTSPFGLSTDWPKTSSTAGVATFSRVKTINVNPSIAYKMSGRASLGFGVDIMKLEATMEKMIAPDTSFRLDGEGTGLGANAALLYKATDQLKLGFAYRSRIKVKVDDATASVSGSINFSNPVETEITLPDLFQAGVSYRMSDRTTVNADIEYTKWSTYDRIVMTSDTFIALTGGTTMTDEKQWKDVFALRIGGQHVLSDHWKLRAGYVYDWNPVPDAHFETRTPDADRQGLTMGTGYTSGPLTVDAAYMFLFFKSRTISDSLVDGSLNGTYKSQAQIFGLNLSYRF